MRAVPIILAAAALAGCATSGNPIPKAIVEDKPVAVSCVPPAWKPITVPIPTPEQLLGLKDGPARYQALQAFYTVYAPVVGAQDQIIAACQSAAPAPK